MGFARVLIHAVFVAVAAGADTGAPAQPPNNDQWSGWGANIYNNRWASTNTQINSGTIGQLVQNCQFTYPLGVSATPVVHNNVVYYPTSNGSLYALNYGTCKYLWEVNVGQIVYDFQVPSSLQMNNTLPISRTSPQIDGDILYFGTLINALLVAVDLGTGEVLGTIQVNNHSLAIVTMSPTVYNGMIFVGASSEEESASTDPGYDCCNFIGNFAAYSFDRKRSRFTQVWNVDTMPPGWAGAGVWGSQPSIDPVRNQVFIGTGNTYIYPSGYEHCATEPASCLPDDVWQESIIALNIPDGKVNWRQTISPLDAWVMACGSPSALSSNSPLCPGLPGPDVDFAMAPTFVPAALGSGTTGNDSVVVGQKNGNLYSLNAATGYIQWNTVTSGNSIAGGLSWGIAVDDTQIYFTAINYGQRTWTLQPSGKTITNSAFGAANLKTGDMVWETACPDNELAYSPPGVVNDLVFVSQSGSGTAPIPGAILALSKTNGSILKSWPLDSVQDGGITVQDGFVMFGTGYHFRNPYNNGSFYVFGLPAAIQAAQEPPDSNGNSNSTSSGTGKKSAATRRSTNEFLMSLYPMVLLVLVVWLV